MRNGKNLSFAGIAAIALALSTGSCGDGYESSLLGNGRPLPHSENSGKPAVRFVFHDAPSSVQDQETVWAPFAVLLLDEDGHVATEDSSTRASLVLNSGHGTLSGNTTQTAQNGVIVFDSITYDEPGTISVGVIDTVTSNQIDNTKVDNVMVNVRPPPVDGTISCGTPTERVSLGTMGEESNGYEPPVNSRGSLTATGRVASFHVVSNNIIPGDTNVAGDILIRDRLTGITEIASLDLDGNQFTTRAWQESELSGDGRFVVFSSYHSNGGVFLRDRLFGHTVEMLIPPYTNSNHGSISFGGRYVAFSYDNVGHVAVYDRILDFYRPVDIKADGTHGASNVSGVPGSTSISSDGRHIAFETYANDLDPSITIPTQIGGFPPLHKLYVHDRDTSGDGTYDESGDFHTSLVSQSTDGSLLTYDVQGVHISGNGRFVAFLSKSPLIADGPTRQVYVRDRDVSGDGFFDEPGDVATALGSVNDAGEAAASFTGAADCLIWNGNRAATLSYDGRFLAFHCAFAGNLDSRLDGTSTRSAVFVRDRDVAGDGHFDEVGDQRTVLASTNVQGDPSPTINAYGSYEPWISADGRFILFHSDERDLVSDDSNATTDHFVTPNPTYQCE